MLSQGAFHSVQILDAPKPDLAYFTDPNQNPTADILKAFTPAGQSLGTVSGPDFISYAPCLVRWDAPHTPVWPFCVALDTYVTAFCARGALTGCPGLASMASTA